MIGRCDCHDEVRWWREKKRERKRKRRDLHEVRRGRVVKMDERCTGMSDVTWKKKAKGDGDGDMMYVI